MILFSSSFNSIGLLGLSAIQDRLNPAEKRSFFNKMLPINDSEISMRPQGFEPRTF
jgi:hypothetical protein